MRSSKLLDVLRSFSASEIKEASLFIERQLDKKDTLPQKLFQILEKYYPAFEQSDIQKERVFNKVFGKQPYSENKLSKLMSELTKMLEAYIIQLKLQEDVLTGKMYLLRYYFERNLDKYFIITAREVGILLDNMPEGSRANILKYQYEELITTYGIKKDNRKANYLKVYSTLNEFIETEKLRWENLTLIEPFPIKYVNVAQKPFYMVHLMLNRLYTTNDEKYFLDTLDYSEQNLKDFAQEEAREVLRILLHYTMLKINMGISVYYPYQLRIYDLMIRLNLILNYYGKIHMATYKNYINCALRLKEFEKAEVFLERYKDYLLEDVKEGAYNFNKAFIFFERGKYEEALGILLNIKLDDLFYSLNQKRIILKAYFELLEKDSSYYELFHSYVHAFKKYIYTKEDIPESHVELNKNFIRFLLKLEDNMNKEKVIKLLDELEHTRFAGERQWLAEKIKKWL